MKTIKPFSVLILLFLVPGWISAQSATPAATPEIKPNMSREERIRIHQAKIDRIIRESQERQKQEAARALQAQQQAQQTAAAGTPAAGTPAAGGVPIAAAGQPLPPGPVGTFVPTPPPPPSAASAAGQASAPKAARSEARSMIYFRPFDSIVNAGDTFATSVMADTKEGSADEVSVLIHYPAGVLNPLALDHSELDTMADSDIEYFHNERDGQIYLHAKLKEPQKLAARRLLQIYWEALSPVGSTDIKFEFKPKLSTALLLKGSNILGTGMETHDGVINATVMVRPKKTKPVVQQITDRDVLVTTNRVVAPQPSMDMRLVASKTSIRQGQEFDVNVMLDNNAHAPLDTLKLYLQFDPAVLEVVDSDSGNWIRKGINIVDGFAHERFPFNFHRLNLVDNEKGYILYEEATDSSPIRSSGIVARIRMRAKQAAESTDVVLVENAPGASPTTEVSYLHKSMLTNAKEQLAARAGVSLRIVEGPLKEAPAQASRAPLKVAGETVRSLLLGRTGW